MRAYNTRTNTRVDLTSVGLTVGGMSIQEFETDDNESEINYQMVAEFNGAVAAYAERQVYSRDHNFRYSLKEGGKPRKASGLIGDIRQDAEGD